MRFKLWLEDIERNRSYWEKFFLAMFRLDRQGGGLGKNVGGLDSKALNGSSEFQGLPASIQQAIMNRIDQGHGTVGDLAGMASGAATQGSAFDFPNRDSV